MSWTLKTIRDRCADDGDCWIWTQCCGSAGYPVASINGKGGINVRRLVYELSGRSLRRGGVVASACFNRKCCNPEHLMGLTRPQVNRRLAEHGRFDTDVAMKSRRENIKLCGGGKLTQEKAREIRARHAAGERQAVIAASYGVSIDAVSKIVRNLRWTEVSANASVFTWAARRA